jgi:tetratricopeptide (TPR) repeat protein
MNENSNHTETLIQYLDGELQGEELESFNKNLENNPLLREELENLQLAREAIWRYGLKSRIGSIHSEVMTEMNLKKPVKAGVIKMYVQTGLRIAAVLIVLIGVSAIYQYLTATPEKLFGENYQPYTIHEMRGEPGGSKLEEKYKAGNMDSVILEFNSLSVAKPEDYILAGVAFLQNNQPEKAIKTFQVLIQKNADDKTDYFEDDAEYYLAMSYLRNREPAKALPILKKIQADPGHPYHNIVSKWFMLKVKSLHQVQHP